MSSVLQPPNHPDGLKGFIAPDHEVADFEAEGFFSPGAIQSLNVDSVTDGCL